MMLFKKCKKHKLDKGSYIKTAFSGNIPVHYKPDEILKLEKRFAEDTKELLHTSATDFTNDDVRDSYSDAIAEYLNNHYEKQKLIIDLGNHKRAVQAEISAQMYEDTSRIFDTLISIYTQRVFKEEQ